MIWRLVWWLAKLGARLGARLALLVVVLGLLAHLPGVQAWIGTTPVVVLQDPNTGAELHKFQPVRTLFYACYFASDFLWEVIN